jgi:hypothetical protein
MISYFHHSLGDPKSVWVYEMAPVSRKRNARLPLGERGEEEENAWGNNFV